MNAIPTLPGERWRPVPGFPGYHVSDHGRVWSDKTRRILRPGTNRHGYHHVILSHRGRTTTHSVHVLVATAFIGPRPPGQEVNHLNGDPTNNRIQNLEYVSHRENALHAIRIGLYRRNGEDNPAAKLTERDVRAIRSAAAEGGITLRELALRYGVSVSAIRLIVNRKNWRHLP